MKRSLIPDNMVIKPGLPRKWQIQPITIFGNGGFVGTNNGRNRIFTLILKPFLAGG